MRVFRPGLIACAVLSLSATAAVAGTHCPPGTYVARYSFGIWMCKQPTRARLACPPGQRLAADLFGTPQCVQRWYRFTPRR